MYEKKIFIEISLVDLSREDVCVAVMVKMDFIYIMITNAKYVVLYVHYDPVVDDH